jgi:D-serine deaminase-like pyridoxal phosphate-dependent protein
VSRGQRDVLLAYPVTRGVEAGVLARANAAGATASVVVDCPEHLELLASAAREANARIPVVLELDVAWRPLGRAVHVGVRRSPLRSPRDVVALARRAADTAGLSFHGVMAYEAQIAGLGDTGVAVRAMKAASAADVVRTRAAIATALRDAGALDLEPAAFFALAVVRRPRSGMVTCHGGGYVASGGAGRDRLPIPALPHGLKLLPLEGAGEVQTPLELAPGVTLQLGDPVFFRHAKAGELAEHFPEYLLVRGERVEGRAPTYRGLGQCFLG